MKDFFLNKILYPGLAILFCLAFGLPFVYTGFQTAVVTGTRTEGGAVILDVDRSHYFGLYHKQIHLEGVEEVQREYLRPRRIGKARRLVSGVYLVVGEEAEMLFAGASNVDDNLKWQAIEEINGFIDSPEQDQFSATYRIRNVFGWFGLPFLVLGLWGLAAWPFSLLRAEKDS